MRIKLSAITNALVIFNFLRPTDARTDLRLRDDLQDYYRYSARSHDIYHFSINNRLCFNEEILDLIEAVVNKGLKPILHIEFHGDVGRGFEFPDGTFLPWGDFLNCMRPLNDLSDHNLGIFLAGCHGTNTLLAQDISKGACFNFLISSVSEVSAGELYDALKDFYISMLDTGLLNNAALHLPDQFEVDVAEHLFIKGFTSYVIDYGRGATFKQRCEDLLTCLVEENPHLDVSAVRKKVKLMLKDHKAHFYSSALKYFGSHDRYKITYDDIMKVVDLEVQAEREGVALQFKPVFD